MVRRFIGCGLSKRIIILAATALLCIGSSPVLMADDGHAKNVDVQAATEQLVSALLGDTPMIDDLRNLTDRIGGRPTGSEANMRSVDWALERFESAGVNVMRQDFEMPGRWLERSAVAEIKAVGGESFSPNIAAMPFSVAMTDLRAPLVDGGRGEADDFARLGDKAKGAWVLVETDKLIDLAGLFAEYSAGAAIEKRAFAADVLGVAYMGSRSRNVLYRHNASRGYANQHPLLIMERDVAKRALRLLRDGDSLELSATVELDDGASTSSANVIGEIRGSEQPDEVVVVGAHLDSWGLGTGALDNGCNVSMLIDIARQIERLGLEPKRTIRFALWNGEEQGFHGSWAYVKERRDALDHHVMAASFDIGSGRISGFFTNGRSELADVLDRSLGAVSGLGPFVHPNVPVVGTDNYDFMIEGVANLVANQESANYGPNYHARSDTFDKVDQQQLRLNSAIVAATIWGFANLDLDLPRHDRAQIETLMQETDLDEQMQRFGVWDSWQSGERGREP